MDGKDFTERNPRPEEADPAAEDDEPTERPQQDAHECNWEELERWRDEIVDFVDSIGRFEETIFGEGRESAQMTAIKAALERYIREQQQNVSQNGENEESLLADVRNIRSGIRDGNSNNDPGNLQDIGSPRIAYQRQRIKTYKDEMKRVLELVKGGIPAADPETTAANANTPSTSRGSGQSAKPNNSAEESPGPICFCQATS
nr:unnamed protein product [Haemonchus contortus]